MPPPKDLSEILAMYPDRVPVIVTGAALERETTRLMVPRSTGVNSFLGLLRSRGLMKEAKRDRAQFLISDDALPASGRTFGDLYDTRSDPSRPALEVVVCEENTFGAFPFAPQNV
jgi:hypothetical protein